MIVTDHTESTCPDSTCEFRNVLGNCTLCTCIYNQMPTNATSETCTLCKYDLDDEDYLYKEYTQDGAIIFEEIICHYCPVCGRKLTRR